MDELGRQKKEGMLSVERLMDGIPRGTQSPEDSKLPWCGDGGHGGPHYSLDPRPPLSLGREGSTCGSGSKTPSKEMLPCLCQQWDTYGTMDSARAHEPSGPETETRIATEVVLALLGV